MKGSLKRILTGLVLIPLVVAMVYLVPPAIFSYLMIILAFCIFSEYLTMFGERKHSTFILVALLMLFLVDSTSKMGLIMNMSLELGVGKMEQLFNSLKYFFLSLWSGVVLVPMLTMAGKDPVDVKFRRLSVYLFGYFYFGLTFGLFPLVRHYGSNYHWLMFALVIPWVCDSAAYFGGKALGKHKFSPLISPNKTWEGTVSGIIFSTVAGAVLAFTLLKDEPKLFVIVTAFAVGILGQFGDLIESLIKRGAGVKDSGTIFPGHGGLFDRLDSLIVSVTVVFVALLVKSYVL